MQGRTLRDKFQAWKYLWQNRGLIKDSDIVHIHDIFWWYLPFRFLFFTKPVFTTFHGWEGDYPPRKSAIIQKRIAKILSKGTIGIGAFFQKWYGVSPDRVSFGVLDPKFMRLPSLDLAQGKRHHSDNLLRIAFYGRLDAVNGIDVALDTFRILKGRSLRTQGPSLRGKFEFLFIGDGPARKEAEKIGQVAGMVKTPRQFLLQADLVITSSYLCMLEAAVLMKPIIAISTNSLKNDYLMSHPLAPYISIARSSQELIDRILSFDLEKNKKKLQLAKNWAVEQIPEKLVDTYTNLWKLLQ